MATANIVEIQIKVDNGQAIPSLDQLNNALKNVGAQGTASFKQAGAAADQAKGHFQTNLDSVRLLSQEFGFRLPRAIESMLSRMPAVTGALNSMIGGLAAIAGIEVFARVAEGAYKLYNEYIDLNAQADKFYETLKKTQEQDIANTRSIETTQMRQDRASSSATNSQRAAQVFHGSAFGDLMQGNIGSFITDLAQAHGLAKDAVTNTSNLIKLGKVELDQTHQRALAQIELNHAMDASLGPAAKASAELAKKTQIDAENRSFDRKQEMYYGNPSPGNAGATEQQMKDQQARDEFSAQMTLIDRKERDERIKAQNEAINAGLEGEARYVAQRDEAIAEITRKYQDGEISRRTARSVTASLEQKYDNEASERLQKQMDQAQQMLREAQQSGLKGGALITAQHNNAIEKINTDRTLDPQAAAIERQAAGITATQKMSELEDQFADHVTSLDAGRVVSSLNAFAKIDASAQKQIADLQKLYDDDFKNAELTDAQKLQAERNLQQGIAAIDAASAEQKRQLAERNSEEDLRYDQQAQQAESRVREAGITGWIASYQNGIANIEGQEHARLVKLQDDVAKEGLTRQEESQRYQDIVRTANAEVEQQNQQMQQKIAGDLQAAFTNPVEFIKSQMEKMFFEIIAGWIMRMNVFKNLFGQTMGSLQPGGAGVASGGIGGILGSAGSLLQGIPGTRGIVSGNPSISGASGSGMASAVGAQANNGSSVGGALSDVSSAAHTLGSLRLPGASDSSGPLAANGQDVDLTGATGTAASSTSNAMSTLGGAAAIGMGGFSAAQTTVKAFESGDPLQGTLGDAAAGASIGMLGGPIGALIGAGVGAAVGAAAGLTGMVSGEAGKLGARDYYRKSVFPQLESYLNNTSTDYQSAVSQVGSTADQALTYMRVHFGRDAAAWVENNYMQKEVARVLARVEDAAAGGRGSLARSAVQFHSGGTIGGFGDLATSGNEGFIHAMLGETVMTPNATRAHGPALNAMLNGASSSDIAAMYLAGSRPFTSAPSGGDTHHHYSISALDAKSFSSFLKNGGAQTIVKHTNRYASQYAGDGING